MRRTAGRCWDLHVWLSCMRLRAYARSCVRLGSGRVLAMSGTVAISSDSWRRRSAAATPIATVPISSHWPTEVTIAEGVQAILSSDSVKHPCEFLQSRELRLPKIEDFFTKPAEGCHVFFVDQVSVADALCFVCFAYSILKKVRLSSISQGKPPEPATVNVRGIFLVPQPTRQPTFLADLSSFQPDSVLVPPSIPNFDGATQGSNPAKRPCSKRRKNMEVSTKLRAAEIFSGPNVAEVPLRPKVIISSEATILEIPSRLVVSNDVGVQSTYHLSIFPEGETNRWRGALRAYHVRSHTLQVYLFYGLFWARSSFTKKFLSDGLATENKQLKAEHK
ncbi:30S ribosomal protein S3 [Striga asiatica]|uniref:30S ribosomal protein S3 n=1 Tax=Striga asiatica TaxID=4170 RepID=A0A5A7QR29_STRAF|nr:30S ribosomal protein S3 [Striga asiatica]